MGISHLNCLIAYFSGFETFPTLRSCLRRLPTIVLTMQSGRVFLVACDKGRYHTLMDFTLRPSFPEVEFRAFGVAARGCSRRCSATKSLYDSLEKRRHFDWSWQAVRYRYRGCTECSEEFKALLDDASQAFVSGMGDEELTYRLERCIYVFFMSALSVFDSFALSLYFLGDAIQPGAFPDVVNPERSRAQRRTRP